MSLGRPFEVETNSEETESWFSSILLHSQDATEDNLTWWQNAATDSLLGILVSVTEPIVSSNDEAGLKATELLFYAAKNEGGVTIRPLTPPESSPTHSHTQAEDEHSFRVYALPLSSQLLRQAKTEPTPPTSPGGDEIDIEPTFLPHYSTTSTQTGEVINRPPVRKRRNVNDAFDEATERRRKARRKGGESVAAAAASHIKAEDSLPQLKHRRSTSNVSVPLQSRPLSRASSVASAKPTSLREQSVAAPSKPSGLSRAQSVSSALELPFVATVEQKNKDFVSKMVMAGMRLYGLYQSKSRKPRSNSAAASPAVDVSFEDLEAEKKNDEEFKLIYHQVYKGTCFATRQHICAVALQPHTDAVRETVDRLLAVFCTDPLLPSADDSGEGYTPGGRKTFGSSAPPPASNPFIQAAIFGDHSAANTPSLKPSKIGGARGDVG
ncbi:hypothetical protein M409DRAFT_69280 [Zasmidium cellare ATCC 36951]|uniref:Sld7 C-terminal domain-containing protein n=1 Tax=Zasmidium cellare ATCC 36951 TaxID=1080233 RepID=A0A6A6C8S6_ZASCE|nr:uncharacterized protein M409DRAFT_69280 [Zasmidium cellare ATCC 36951]KAF2162039.1 hypothetical protein M409DRAFT_69280 [Zasmidium cellare ATCC 36951]